ncbi:MAG: peroxidase-related enzyme [Alphaproteobacteria bacterium]|jgi:uncharacterized peroxidase-related enzyme
MPRLNPIDPNEAEGKAKTLLKGVEKALGMTPNLMRTLANSPAALEAYLSFANALGNGRLSAKLREQIALAVSNANGCAYCASAHTAVGKMLGLDAAELTNNLHASSGDPKVEAALKFAHAIIAKEGWLGDDDLQHVRDAGYDDGEIVELVAATAFTIFTNYFNHIAETEVDFPLVAVDELAAA